MSKGSGESERKKNTTPQNMKNVIKITEHKISIYNIFYDKYIVIDLNFHII